MSIMIVVSSMVIPVSSELTPTLSAVDATGSKGPLLHRAVKIGASAISSREERSVCARHHVCQW